MDKGRYREELRALEESCKPIDEAIARQSAISEEVAEAIEDLEYALACSENGGFYVEQTIKQPTARLSITALQEYQHWIPVSNGKPEKSGRYIAYVPEHWTNEGHKDGKVIIAYFRELNYERRRRVWDDGAYGISGEVTHYRPMP